MLHRGERFAIFSALAFRATSSLWKVLSTPEELPVVDTRPRDARCYFDGTWQVTQPAPPPPVELKPSITFAVGTSGCVLSSRICNVCGNAYEPDIVHQVEVLGGGRVTYVGCDHCVAAAIQAQAKPR